MSLKSSTNTEVNTYELILEIDAEKFDKAVDSVYNKQKKNITISGFRKGKASRKMVEKTYGEGVFYEDAINAMIPEELGDAVSKSELNLVDQPKVEVVSIDKNDGVVLKAICTIKPEVKIADYSGIKAPKIVKDITDAEVDAQLESLRAKNARIISVDDRAAEPKDEVTIDFEGFKDGEAFEGGQAEDFPLTLGSGQFIPGFEEQVIGHSIGEEFEINVTFPENYQMEELAGQPVVFKINLKEIKRQELPELDDDFVKDTTEFDTLEELKADCKAKLLETAEKAAASSYENALYQSLIKNLEGEIPQCMFDRRVDALINEFDQRLRSQSMNLDTYLQYTGMDMDSFRDTFMERAKDEVVLRLALEKIAELENMTVSDEELETSLAEMAKTYQMDVDAIKKLISIDDYKTDLLAGKAADFVRENAVVDNTIAETAEESTEEKAD